MAKRLPLSKRAEAMVVALRKLPANGKAPYSAGELAEVVDGYLSMHFMVQHLYRERFAIMQALGLQVDGPDADLDGYPDLAFLVSEALDGLKDDVAHANKKMWEALEGKEAANG